MTETRPGRGGRIADAVAGAVDSNPEAIHYFREARRAVAAACEVLEKKGAIVHAQLPTTLVV